ncbi:hypothetical protein M422DRAFT_23553, partial [Sphaerobolus stellatus SS14]
PVTGRRRTENAQLVLHWGRWTIKLHCVQDGTRNSVGLIIDLEACSQDAKLGGHLFVERPFTRSTGSSFYIQINTVNLILSRYFQLIFFPQAFYPC